MSASLDVNGQMRCAVRRGSGQRPARSTYVYTSCGLVLPLEMIKHTMVATIIMCMLCKDTHWPTLVGSAVEAPVQDASSNA